MDKIEETRARRMGLIDKLPYFAAGGYTTQDTLRSLCQDAAFELGDMRKKLAAYEDAEEQGRLVQAVKCKDCIFLNKDIAGYGNEHPCRLHSSEVMTCWKQPEQYCSSGEEAESAAELTPGLA